MTVVSSEFWALSLTEAQARGVKDLPLVKVPRMVAESAVDSIAAKLVRGNGATSYGDARSSQDGEGNVAASLLVPSDPAETFSFFSDRGWTDGLPVLPPTLAAVRKMVATVAHG